MAKLSRVPELTVANLSVNNPDILLPDRPIAFNRDFVKLGIGVNGALFLSQAIYWSKRTKDEDGWFYKTIEDWEDETGLTKHEQLSVKANLVKNNYLKVEKRGIPAKNYFLINTYQIASELVLIQGGYDHKKSETPTTGGTESVRHTYTENTTESTASAEEEINDYLGFPLPVDWSDNSYVDSEGNYVAVFKDRFSRPIKPADIKAHKTKYLASQKSKATREKNSDPVAKEMVEILKTEQELTYLDGGENIKHALAFKIKFGEHLVKDMGIDSSQLESRFLSNFRAFLGMVKGSSPFHWKNMTNFGYMDRNFNKIIRELK